MPKDEDPLAEMERRISDELGVPDNADSIQKYLQSIPVQKVHAAMLRAYTTNPDGSWVGGRQPATAYEIVEDLRKKHGSRIQEDEYQRIYETSNAIIISQNVSAAVPFVVGMANGPDGARYRKIIADVLGIQSTLE